MTERGGKILPDKRKRANTDRGPYYRCVNDTHGKLGDGEFSLHHLQPILME